MSKCFFFLGILGRVFFKFDTGKVLKKFIIVDGGSEPTTQKTKVCRRRHLSRIYRGISPFTQFFQKVNQLCEIKGGGHRVPPAGLPIEQVLGEYSLSFLRRDVALFVSTRARDIF